MGETIVGFTECAYTSLQAQCLLLKYLSFILDSTLTRLINSTVPRTKLATRSQFYLSLSSLLEQYRLIIWCLVICSRDLLFMVEEPGLGREEVGYTGEGTVYKSTVSVSDNAKKFRSLFSPLLRFSWFTDNIVGLMFSCVWWPFSSELCCGRLLTVFRPISLFSGSLESRCTLELDKFSSRHTLELERIWDNSRSSQCQAMSQQIGWWMRWC